MTITEPRLERAEGNRQRVAVDAVYQDGARETIWFDMPEEIPASRTGTPGWR